MSNDRPAGHPFPGMFTEDYVCPLKLWEDEDEEFQKECDAKMEALDWMCETLGAMCSSRDEGIVNGVACEMVG